MEPLRVAVVGCGNIATGYAQTLEPHDEVAIVAATDLDKQRADAFVDRWGGRRYETLEDVLADSGIDLIINLTTHHSHPAVILASLRAGKHVYSEKPLASNREDAHEIMRVAEANGVRLACAPMTFLGEAQQTAWKVLREGRLGSIKVAYAEANWGRLEDWHPNPASLLDAGALFDVGPYPVTLLTTFFGPACTVIAMGKTVYAKRTRLDGQSFTITAPDFVAGMIEFSNGVLARLTTTFYVSMTSKQKGIEIHGDTASLFLESWQNFDARVEIADYGKSYRPVPYVKTPYVGTEWGRGVVDMARAIAEGRPHRVTGQQAAHVAEILCALDESRLTRHAVDILSVFESPQPMDWAT